MIDTYYLMVMGVTLAFNWGLSYCFHSDEVFGLAGDWMRKHWPEWVNKPLFDCPYCMSSIYGSLSFVVFLWGYPWFLWVIFCFCLTGLSALIKE